MPLRCALGCPPSKVSFHIFPHPDKFPETFKAWVAIVEGNLETPKDNEYYRKKRICDIHFTPEVKNRNNRLNCLAVPTLFLPNSAVQQNQLDVERRPHPMGISQHLLDLPSTSTGLLTDSPVLQNQMDVESRSHPMGIREHLLDLPSTSKDWPIANWIHSEHNYSTVRHLDPDKIIQTIKRKKPLNIYERKIKSLKTQINRMRKIGKAYQSRLANAERLSNESAFRRVAEKMTASSKLFTKMQMTQTSKKPSGRRFTLHEKILSLSLYKRSPKSYRLLSSLFTLPSPKTLKVLLAKVQLSSGLNNIIFDKMTETVKGLNIEDRLCSLMFDEMSIDPQIHYDSHKDELRGFSDFDSKKIANHVLVFMIKGVRMNFKQPVAYYFTNSIKTFDLKKTIINVIKKVQATGLIVLCTVCDQGTANVSAINSLIEDTKKKYIVNGKSWRHDMFEVNGKQIVPLYDVPHLLKGLRNNMLTKHLKFIDFDDNGREKIVKWDYFQEVYSADKCQGELRLLNKITEEHINVQKMKKMRVKTAAQIFSHNMAVVTDHLSARGLVSEECRQLIPFTLFIDKLFDSLNVSCFNAPNGKEYRGCVKRYSPHHQLWQNAIKTLKSTKFITKKTNDNQTRFIECTVHL